MGIEPVRPFPLSRIPTTLSPSTSTPKPSANRFVGVSSSCCSSSWGPPSRCRSRSAHPGLPSPDRVRGGGGGVGGGDAAGGGGRSRSSRGIAAPGREGEHRRSTRRANQPQYQTGSRPPAIVRCCLATSPSVRRAYFSRRSFHRCARSSSAGCAPSLSRPRNVATTESSTSPPATRFTVTDARPIAFRRQLHLLKTGVQG